MSFGDLDKMFSVLAFVIPGFLSHGVQSAFVPQRKESSQLTVLRCLTFGALNFAIWSWLIYLLNASSVFQGHPGRMAAGWLFVFFVGPILVGLVSGNMRQGFALRLLQRMKFNPMHFVPTAWDYKFMAVGKKPPHHEWVRVTLKDGRVIAGFYASESFCSTDPDERDILIEKVYTESEEGAWTAVPLNRGILIRGDEIRFIEFVEGDSCQTVDDPCGKASSRRGLRTLLGTVLRVLLFRRDHKNR